MKRVFFAVALSVVLLAGNGLMAISPIGHDGDNSEGTNFSTLQPSTALPDYSRGLGLNEFGQGDKTPGSSSSR